ncbi:MAG: tetratricopeptide repeat protein [Rhodobacteraceae bacterium]|nr:MAG: tetratricopeptide repeat protein [Paracoccaceae bacterium]
MTDARHFVLSLAVAVAMAGPALAQRAGDHHPEAEATTPSERLDSLFSALSDPEATDATLVQRRITEIWSASGSESMDYLLRRGRRAMDAEQYDKAIDHLTALTRLAPDFVEGWNMRATAHFYVDEYWSAVADIQQTLMLEPRHFGALAGLGTILERVGDERGALIAWREAARLNPHLGAATEALRRLEAKVDGRDI